jgi:hypothetical protein
MNKHDHDQAVTDDADDGTEPRREPLRRFFSLEDLLADPPTPEERAERRSELKWFDTSVRPYLYRLVRYELEIPGRLATRGHYWVCPRAGFKVDLRCGIVYDLRTGKRAAYYFDLWMMCKDFTRFNFPAAKDALRVWIVKQQTLNPEPDEIPLFTEDPVKLDWIFFWIMFRCGPEGIYRGTGRKLWLELKKIYGPVATRYLPDLRSSHQLLRFLRYRAEHPSPLFSVAKVSGPAMKEEIWEVRDRGYNAIRAEFAPYAEAYSRAHLSAGYGDPALALYAAALQDPALAAEIEAEWKAAMEAAEAEAEAAAPPKTDPLGNSVSRYGVGHRAIGHKASLTQDTITQGTKSEITPNTIYEILPKAVCSPEQTNGIPYPTGAGKAPGVSPGGDTGVLTHPEFLELRSGIRIPYRPSERATAPAWSWTPGGEGGDGA